MLLDVNDRTLFQIKNISLRNYAGIYVSIYKEFMQQVSETGIEIDKQDYSVQVKEKIEALRKRGVTLRNNNKSLCYGKISPACIACQTGVGSSTFFISLQCHRNCYYCFNPNQEKFDYYQSHKRDVVQELKQLKEKRQRVRHLALTGGEPLLHKEETLNFFQYATDNIPEAYTRLYTSGDHIDAQILQNLKDAGLREIRFSIRMHDLEANQEHTLKKIRLAKEYIPYVMVEMPVLPDTLTEMKAILVKLDELELFSINLLELCYPLANAEIFNEKGFKIKNEPFHILYDYWYAGGLPVAGSELVCLDLLAFASDSNLSLGVHYCSVENKQTGQIYQQNSVRPLPEIAYYSQRDYFLKTAKVFGDDIARVSEFFEKKGYKDYEIVEEHNYMEFHINKVRALAKLDIEEVGISYSVLENRNNEMMIREVKVDIACPKTFQLSKDV